MGTYRDLATIGTHAEARRGFTRRAKTVWITIGLWGDRLVIAVLVGMVTVMRIAADQTAVLMMMRMMMMVTASRPTTTPTGTTTTWIANAMHIVHSPLRVTPRTFCAANSSRCHGRRIAALFSMMMMVGRTRRGRRHCRQLCVSRCHCVAVGATARGMWRTGRAVANLSECLYIWMRQYADGGAGQVPATDSCCGPSGHHGRNNTRHWLLLLLLLFLRTHNWNTSCLALGRVVILPKWKTNWFNI